MAKTYRSAKRALIIVLAAVISLTLFIVLFAKDGGSALDNVYRFFGVFPQQSTADFVSFIDVGQGDSVLISSNGYNALVDTGPPESQDELLENMEELRVDDIDVLVISHLHNDHTGGIKALCENYSIDKLIGPDLEKKSNKDTDIAKQTVLSQGGKVYTAQAGMNFTLGDFEITVLGYYPDMEDENNRSVIVMAKIGDYKFLLTGDAQAKTENRLLLDGINLDCDVLKAGHHGSKTSTSEKFLEAASPQFSVISVGEGNKYNHPSPSVLEDLEDASGVLRTDEDGTVTFHIRNNKLSCNKEKD
jgi:competence protein ComEC